MRVSRRTVVVLALALLALTGASGCFRREFPSKRQYVIAVDRSGPPRPRSAGVLRLSHVSASVQYDRKSFVYRTGELTYADDFYNAFYVPPTRLVNAIVSRWLEASGLFSAVVDSASIASADWTMELRIAELYVDQRDKKAPAAVAGIEATVLPAGRSKVEPILERRYSESEPASARNGDAYVAAWGTAFARVLTKLEADLAVAVAVGR